MRLVRLPSETARELERRRFRVHPIDPLSGLYILSERAIYEALTCGLKIEIIP